jgi:peptide/nickel transport system substrate-binding protein
MDQGPARGIFLGFETTNGGEMNVLRKAILAAACTAGLAAAATPALAQTTLRAVMHSDLKILDPIWTTAYIVRNHGYMIYDTLLAQDEKGAVQPQMVEKYETAPDGKGYTFTLRDGLLWHDGKPVTSEDCIASIKRWAVKDSLGQKMMTFVDSIDAVDAKTFTIKLKEPTGLVLLGLSKPSSNVRPWSRSDREFSDPNASLRARSSGQEPALPQPQGRRYRRQQEWLF